MAADVPPKSELLKLPTVVSCFVLMASRATSEVSETSAAAVKGVENLNTGAAGTKEVSETGATAAGAVDPNLNTGEAGTEEVSEACATAVESVEDPNLNTDAVGCEEVSETGATSAEAFDDPKFNTGSEGAGDEVDKLSLLEDVRVPTVEILLPLFAKSKPFDGF